MKKFNNCKKGKVYSVIRNNVPNVLFLHKLIYKFTLMQQNYKCNSSKWYKIILKIKLKNWDSEFLFWLSMLRTWRYVHKDVGLLPGLPHDLRIWIASSTVWVADVAYVWRCCGCGCAVDLQLKLQFDPQPRNFYMLQVCCKKEKKKWDSTGNWILLRKFRVNVE